MKKKIQAEHEEYPAYAASDLKTNDPTRTIVSLSDTIEPSPGTRLIQRGAFGQQTTLSVRGTDASQNLVLFGDVPLSTEDSGVFDLSLLPPEMIERVEVIRGAQPLLIASNPIGGVIRLTPAHSERTRFGATLRTGSFGLYQARLRGSVNRPGESLNTAAGVSSSSGNFTYNNPNNTTLVSDDDFETERRNAEVRQGHSLLYYRRDWAHRSAKVFAWGIGRNGGVPGPIVQETSYTRRATRQAMLALSFEQRSSECSAQDSDCDWLFQLTAASQFRNDRFTDLYREIALIPKSSDDYLFSQLLYGFGKVALSEYIEAQLMLSSSWSHNDPNDSQSVVELRDSDRLRFATGAGLRFHTLLFGQPVELTPAIRFETVRAALSDIRSGLEANRQDFDGGELSYQLAGAYQLLDFLSLSAALSRATRFPSMVELFGDRAFLQGNNDLRQERAWQAHVGTHLKQRWSWFELVLQSRVFSLWIDNLIRYRLNSQYIAIPENISGATIAGVESSSQLTFFDRAKLYLSSTWIDAQNEQGATLPLRPALQGYGRFDLTLDGIVPAQPKLYADINHVSANYLSEANTAQLPPRTRVGVGLSLQAIREHWLIKVDLRDLFDQRGIDIAGYPLPGRTIFIELQIEETI